MDQSRRAVESYRRSRLIDGATSDEDKVTPVYKLEEICELLRSSHVSVVKELSEFILKRLQHKSPIVKQKALRVIKYAVGKSGAEFRREMQRNSAAVREFIHYKGHPDPLKGDSLNKSVRETAQDALSALFANEDRKAPTTENLGSRIQGFGNTNFQFVSEDTNSSFLSEVVNIGSATIKQGISSLTQSPSLKKNDVGTYKGPNLRRSLTTESGFNDQYEGFSGSSGDTHTSSRSSKTANSGNWGTSDGTDEDSQSSNGERTREQRLLETIVTSGGVRLQPSRDALHVFLTEVSKLDALVLSHAIDSKLISPHWQVRIKAICVLEALLRKKDDEHFTIVATYFRENKDMIINCSESPQASLREKAIKVLTLLDGEQKVDGVGKNESKPTSESTDTQIPNLIDTGDSDNLFETSEHKETYNTPTTEVTSTSSSSLIDDLFGGSPSSDSNNHVLAYDDPFADVSFHSSKEEQEADLFSGITVNKQVATEPQVIGSDNGGPELFDIFGPSPNLSADQNTSKENESDIMAGLSINDNGTSAKQNSTFARAFPESLSTNADHRFSPGYNLSYNYQPGFVFNPSLVHQQPMNYNSMVNMLAQQQYLATMPGFQGHIGNLQSNSSALPDIFNPSLSSQPHTSLMSSSKKEETKAFDFISEHIAAARDPRRAI